MSICIRACNRRKPLASRFRQSMDRSISSWFRSRRPDCRVPRSRTILLRTHYPKAV
ncbi:unnamed protein product [Ciceribacter sp. T2.26MG-112.2]|uniref:Uncharacterized protein n=1 Tax=Ciceribacter selenitireducens ATCC BAA-1503 TaxID=1336235 RepID=A0A376AAR9_9HYPH|nr:unnamed protein product [Ciceribacter selenitireducens ATCC BAA-1503]SSC72618.1 unnamed protein product [Ciceribacter naphthalenivorans]